MRTVWVSFDAMGRVCLVAAAEAGAELVGVVTLPGPIDPHRSGQAPFDDVAERYGAALIETADVNAEETIAAVRASSEAAVAAALEEALAWPEPEPAERFEDGGAG